MLKKLIGLVVVVVLVGGAALWWFVLRDDPPPKPTTSDVETTTDSADGSTPATTPESLDGSWSVADSDDAFAGFRITESFANGLTDHTAVGRSKEVDGSITVAGTQITEGDVTVDLTALTFTDDPGLSVTNRANAMKSRGLQTGTFPDASFELTKPIDFGQKPAEDQEITATATGNLTIHGVTNEVTFDVQARIVGDKIVVAASDIPVVLADYDIEKPTGGPVAEIADQGTFELLLVFEQG